jgi:hypothetical protein
MLLSSDTFMGTRNDLLKLTCRPLEYEKLLKSSLRVKRILADADMMSKVSSAY